MHHDTPLITTIVAGLVLAYIFGMIANRFRLPPLVGYLFAGILVGPNTPGFVADQAVGAELAELGVILLMFGVGLHFSLKDLMSVRALAIPGAVAQIALATALGAGLGLLLGWELGAALLFGLALSVASTVVLLKALQDRRLIETERGRIAVGWLIVEDLAMVLALVLIPAIAGLNGVDTGVHDPFVSFVERIAGVEIGIWGVLALTLVKVAAFVGFMLVVGRRIIPWALHGTAHTGSRELFRLAVLAIALGVALGSAVLFGVSLALGAFFAGMILSESELSHRAAQETLPLRDAFSVLFFVSVGMLFDPAILITDPLPVLATVFIIVIGKSLAAYGIVRLFKRPAATALTISASLAQIGEFSFILASMGVALTILPTEAKDLILAGALISIVLNPAAFWAVDLVKPRFEAKAAARNAARAEHDGVRIEPVDISAAVGPLTSDMPAPETPTAGVDDDTVMPTQLTDHTVMVGYGQVGRIIADGLKAAGAPLLVIEDSDNDVAAARADGFEVIFGNGAAPDVLRLANIENARSLVLAISNGFEAGTVCETGRKLNPAIRIVARAHSEDEDAYLRGLGANIVIRGEREIGMAMLAYAGGSADIAPAEIKPTEPQLPPVENILEQVAAAPTAVAVASAATVVADALVALDASTLETQPATDAEPVVIAEVEGQPEPETVIQLPGPVEAAAEPDVSEPAVEVPAVGEAPAAIDEVVIPEVDAAAETAVAMVAPANAEVTEAPIDPATTEVTDDLAVDAETAAEAEDQTSEGGIAPPEDGDERHEEVIVKEDDLPVVPVVVPEPKS